MDYSLLVIKIQVNNNEYDFLFNINNNYLNEDNNINNKENDNNNLNDNNNKDNNINIDKNINNDNNINIEPNTNNDNIKFNNEKSNNFLDEIQMNISKVNINCIKKYLFKSTTTDIVYILGIIDFFQVYDMKKKIEARLKRVNTNKFSISSINSKDYKIRFINNFENITNYDLLDEKFENLEENE
jgi:hypothetical protein